MTFNNRNKKNNYTTRYLKVTNLILRLTTPSSHFILFSHNANKQPLLHTVYPTIYVCLIWGLANNIGVVLSTTTEFHTQMLDSHIDED